MSKKISPSVNKTYGIERTCSVWNISRSTFIGRKRMEKAPLSVVRKARIAMRKF